MVQGDIGISEDEAAISENISMMRLILGHGIWEFCRIAEYGHFPVPDEFHWGSDGMSSGGNGAGVRTDTIVRQCN
jgi:hypothetical protein